MVMDPDVIAKVDPNSPNVQQNWLRWALNAVSDHLADYQNFEDYYIGDHKLAFATDKWTEVFSSEFKEFADNWCAVVVDSMVQRMRITGWACDESDKFAKMAQTIWDREILEIEATDLHTQTAVKGDGYLIVWENPDVPGQAQLYYNDPVEVAIYYDPANRRRRLRAAKRFIDEQNQTHIYLYFPDRCEKYFTPNQLTPDEVAAMFLAMQDTGFSQTMPGGFILEDSPVPNPYNTVPVFHFKNRSLGANNGISELKSVIPIQNAVNKLLMDMMVASEFGSFRQKWMAGGGHPKDGWKSTASRIWATTDPTAKFGEFGQTDLEPIFKAIEVLVGHIAKITQTPMHYLRASGDMPSGEALKTAESGLVKKCIQRQVEWGASWMQAMTFAVRIESGGAELPGPIYPIWQSPETRHDLEQAQTAQLKSILGIPLEQVWAEHMNYTQEQIEEFKQSNHAIAASVLAEVIAQVGQLPPGTGQIAATPEQLVQLLQAAPMDNTNTPQGGGLNIAEILALLPKGVTGQTTAGEATTHPQPATKPPASATRKQRGYDSGPPSSMRD